MQPLILSTFSKYLSFPRVSGGCTGICSLSPWTWNEDTAHVITHVHDVRQEFGPRPQRAATGWPAEELSIRDEGRVPALLLAAAPLSRTRPVCAAPGEGASGHFCTDRKEAKGTIVFCVSVPCCRLTNSSPNQCYDYLILIFIDEETASDMKENTEVDRGLAEWGFGCRRGQFNVIRWWWGAWKCF